MIIVINFVNINEKQQAHNLYYNYPNDVGWSRIAGGLLIF